MKGATSYIQPNQLREHVPDRGRGTITRGIEAAKPLAVIKPTCSETYLSFLISMRLPKTSLTVLHLLLLSTEPCLIILCRPSTMVLIQPVSSAQLVNQPSCPLTEPVE